MISTMLEPSVTDHGCCVCWSGEIRRFSVYIGEPVALSLTHQRSVPGPGGKQERRRRRSITVGSFLAVDGSANSSNIAQLLLLY